MTAKILTVTLNPAIDQFVFLKEEAGVGQIRNVQVKAGGKGINAARLLKILRVPTIATGFIGGETGRWIKFSLAAEGIPCHFIQIKGVTRTNLTFVNLKRNEIHRSLQEGPAVTSKEAAAFKKAFRHQLKFSACVVFSGRAIKGGEQLFTQLVKLTKTAGNSVVVDTSGDLLKRALRLQPFLIKPNRKEAEDVLHKKIVGKKAIRRALADFAAQGVSVPLISLAEEGAALSNGEDFWLARAPAVKAVNNVGCGDALLAGFLYAWKERFSLPDCLRFAVAAGTVHAMTLPGISVKKADIRKLVQRVRIERL